MGKNRRDFGGTYAFSSCAIKKKPLQIGVIYRRIWQRRGVDDKLLNVPFPSLCRCCVLGSLVQFIFLFFFKRVFFHFSNSDLFFFNHWSFYFLSFIKKQDFFFFPFNVFSFYYQTVSFLFNQVSTVVFVFNNSLFISLNFFESMVVFIF